MTNLMDDYDPYERLDEGPPGKKDAHKLENLFKLLERLIKVVLKKLKDGVK